MPDTVIEYEDSGQSGGTLFAVARRAGQWAKGVVLEPYDPADFPEYAIPLDEDGASGYFQGPTPALPPGTYTVGIRAQQGAAPDESDPSLGGFTRDWDGAAWHTGTPPDAYTQAALYGDVDPQDSAGRQVFRAPADAPDAGTPRLRFSPTCPRGGRTVELDPTS